jgi:predicted unusual protein kinase regulating ubiquinone biosynthesis (AarF/ABC1/UbiB family)
MSGEQMVAELQQTVKQLLAHGARLPKVLMLFVKDMLFIDGAILHLAPDIDLMAEVATIAGTITERRRDLQQRREVIREKMEEQRRSGSIREMRRSLRRRG